MNTISYKDLPAMLDVKQAAQILNCSPRTVSRMCAKGDLKAVKTLSMWRVNRDALLRYAGIEIGEA